MSRLARILWCLVLSVYLGVAWALLSASVPIAEPDPSPAADIRIA